MNQFQQAFYVGLRHAIVVGQVGLWKEVRIDSELDELLAANGHSSVSEIVGKLRFAA